MPGKSAEHSFTGTITSPWTPAFNSNVMDAEKMTSAEAQAARAQSAEIMAALRKDGPGAAERMLGDRRTGNDNDGLIFAGKDLWSKFFGKDGKDRKDGKGGEGGEKGKKVN